MKTSDAVSQFNMNMAAKNQLGDYNSGPVVLDGKKNMLFGGTQLSDRNFNNEQPGAGTLSQTGFDGLHGIPAC